MIQNQNCKIIFWNKSQIQQHWAIKYYSNFYQKHHITISGQYLLGTLTISENHSGISLQIILRIFLIAMQLKFFKDVFQRLFKIQPKVTNFFICICLKMFCHLIIAFLGVLLTLVQCKHQHSLEMFLEVHSLISLPVCSNSPRWRNQPSGLQFPNYCLNVNGYI